MASLLRVIRSLILSSPSSSLCNFRNVSSAKESRRFGYCNSDQISQKAPESMDKELKDFIETLDPDSRRRLQEYMTEFEIYKQADANMPSRLQVNHWRRLLRLTSKGVRIRYFTYLYEMEQNRRIKEEEKQSLPERLRTIRGEIKRKAEDHIYYGLGGNGIFSRFRDPQMHRSLNSRLVLAMMTGPRVIFDMSFLPSLQPLEFTLTANQLQHAFNQNRSHRFPHHLIFTGCALNHESWKDLNRYFPIDQVSDFCTVTEKNYVDLFPINQLVYLSGDARTKMIEYDSDSVYIIGAFANVQRGKNIALGKAKEDGVEARYFSVERFLRIPNRRMLFLQQTLKILNDANAFGSLSSSIINNMPIKTFEKKFSDEEWRNKQEFEKQRLDYLRYLSYSSA